MNKSLLFFIVTLLIYPLAVFAKSTTNPPKDKFVVVLDAGHGGHDPGNLGNGFLEKNIALNIVLQAGAMLEKKPDIKVIYTRKEDVFVDLYKRGEIANKANADLFVSIHCDAHRSEAYGAGTFVLGLHANRQNFEVAKKENSVIYLEDNYERRYAKYDINSPESVIGLTIMQEEFLDKSILLGKKLQDNFTQRLKRKDRRVKQAGFIVLHQTFMPSVLIEAGFLTNKVEGSYLNSQKGQLEMGKAIADAILAYRNDVADGFDLKDVVLEKNTQEVQKKPVPTTPKIASQQKITNPQSTASQIPNTKTKIIVNVPVAASQNDDYQDYDLKDSKAGTQIVHTPIVAPKETISEQKQHQNVSRPVISNDRSSYTGVVFKIQLLASSKNLPLTPAKFRGLDVLSKEPYKNLYRYMYGNTNSIREAERLKAEAVSKGYTSAYLVAYKNGIRIPVWKALR